MKEKLEKVAAFVLDQFEFAGMYPKAALFFAALGAVVASVAWIVAR